MKRYGIRLDTNIDGEPKIRIYTSQQGEWVRWEDVVCTGCFDPNCNGAKPAFRTPTINITMEDLTNRENYTWEQEKEADAQVREFDEFIEKHNQALKVFCKECEYLGRSYADIHEYSHGYGKKIYTCSRSKLNTKDTWYAPNVQYALKPSERNKHNDCSLFKRKGE